MLYFYLVNLLTCKVNKLFNLTLKMNPLVSEGLNEKPYEILSRPYYKNSGCKKNPVLLLHIYLNDWVQ